LGSFYRVLCGRKLKESFHEAGALPKPDKVQKFAVAVEHDGSITKPKGGYVTILSIVIQD
jgi:hypothetical protein